MAPAGLRRFAPVTLFTAGPPGEVVATEEAKELPSRISHVLASLRRGLVGPPLGSSAVIHERMRKLVALPVLSSDLLSSVAYGPEAMLAVLVLAGGGALGVSLPIGGVLVLLMVAVGLSYRQTIRAYPSGAGSYAVAADNLGRLPSLVAAAGLMTDYVLTVAVSIAAGIAAITAAAPLLHGQQVVLGLAAIAFLLAGNLRGVRQAGNLFAAPTYAFLAAIFLVVSMGLVQAGARHFAALPPAPVEHIESLNLLLVLRAFASGASSMTGIEAASNAIPAFEPVEWRNARTTLSWMVGLLVTMFAGLVAVFHLEGIVPNSSETMLSQLAHQALGGGPLYAYVQAATALILLLAANTAFNGFPRLLFFLARDGYAPRAFVRLGDRLAFSNGILALAVAAAAVYTAFGGTTERLIPLYAVGVFLAFTLSQAGMVVHWWRGRDAGWGRSMAINGIGAALSGVVLVIAAITKFRDDAWAVVIGIPLLVWLALRIGRHSEAVARARALHRLPERPARAIVPAVARGRLQTASATAGQREQEESPEELRHMVIVPIARLDLVGLRALAYAASLGQPVLAVHLSPEDEEAERFRCQWCEWGDHVPLEIVASPYRAVVAPLVHYIQGLHRQQPDLTLTIVVPEVEVQRFWHRLLHSHLGPRLRSGLRSEPGIVIASVPFHVSG